MTAKRETRRFVLAFSLFAAGLAVAVSACSCPAWAGEQTQVPQPNEAVGDKAAADAQPQQAAGSASASEASPEKADSAPAAETSQPDQATTGEAGADASKQQEAAGSDAAPEAAQQEKAADTKIGPETQQEIDVFKAAHTRFIEFYGKKRYEEAEVEVRKALDIARRLLGNEHLITATEMNNMAALFASTGRQQEAAPLFAEALAVRRKLLEPQDPRILGTLEDLQVTLSTLGRASEERAALEAMMPFYDGAVPQNPDRLAYALDRLGVLDINAGDYASARSRLERAVLLTESLFGKEHTRYALSLSNLAVVDVKEKKLDEALARFSEVVGLRTRLLGESDDLTLQTMGEIAGIYNELNRHQEAMASARAIIELREKAKGADDAALAGDHNRFSAYAYRAGDYDLSGRELARAIEIAEKHGGAESPELLTYLSNLATLLEELGAYDRAEPVYRRRLALLEKQEGQRSAKAVDAIASLGALNRQLVRYDEAERLFFDALARETQAQQGERDKSPLRIGNIHNHIAGLYRALGRFDDAAAQYRKAEALFIEDRSTPPEEMAKLLDNIGVLNMELDQFDVAEAYQKRALALFEQSLGPQHADTALCLHNLATVYHQQGRDELALPLYKQALVLYAKQARSSDPLIGVFNDNIAGAYRKAGDYEEAEKYYQLALKALVKAHGEEHPEVALAYSNLATFRAERGDFRDAAVLYDKALRLSEMSLGVGHPRIAHILRLIGENEMALGDFKAAGASYRRAFDIAEKVYGADHEQTGRIIGNLAAMELLRQDYAAALALYRRAARIEEARLKHRQAKSDDDNGARADNNLFAGLAISLWFVAEQAAPAEREQLREEALVAAQRAQSSSAGAALAQMSARFAAGDGALANAVRERQDLVRRHARFDAKLVELIGSARSEGDDQLIASLRQTLDDMQKQIEALDAQLQREFPDYASLADPQPLKEAEIRNQLGADEALLLYITSNEAVYEFALTREGVDWRREALKRSDLRETVARLRAALDPLDPGNAARSLPAESSASPAMGLVQTASTSFDLAAAYSLHKALLAPFDRLLAGKRHLFVIASDALTGLPFHVLVTAPPLAKSGNEYAIYRATPWLIRRFAVTTLPSVTSLAALRGGGGAAESAAKPLIGFGDPVFRPVAEPAPAAEPLQPAQVASRGFSSYFRGGAVNLAALSRLTSLPETRDELVDVAKTLGVAQSELKLGRDASEKEVKELDREGELANRRIVYFATHGLVAGDIRGLAEPALALSLPATASNEDDGLLTASEVTQLKLNADWVVLSACNTAAGTEPGAEALSGLARAFFYAGAKSLLVSHWPVYSDAATLLTTRAFRIIEDEKAKGKTVGRAEALRRSMLALVDNKKGGFASHPSYWAPFVVVGEGGR